MHDSVKSFLVPVAKFPQIDQSATFAEAVLALEKAQEEYASGKREQRILLVRGEGGRIAGKLSPIDVVRGLEPDYDKIVPAPASAFVSSTYVINTMKDLALLWSSPLADLCATARNLRIKDFLRAPEASQRIGIDDTLNAAFHRFVLFRHDSLFVMDGHKLVGMLRFSDVYREIVHRVKQTCIL
ncbi:CBS domain-containing protein [Desulfocurvus sp.]|jgi:hypothetical protein|uniref:CBS domain-containing protein n=1 Tax=Desulfocurvus sp. TaxID=2871698 RepID=UPI0025BB9473|nr:CBS domain-containing protein [Desulfocurvus sp.]MCK9240985.1 hypothetical protein [Desulfocurvus sp.]